MRCQAISAGSRSTTTTRSTRGSASASTREKPTPRPPISTLYAVPAWRLKGRADQQPLGSAVAGVHQEHAVADDLEVLAVPAQHQLAARGVDPVEHLHAAQGPTWQDQPLTRTAPDVVAAADAGDLDVLAGLRER